ncbi:MAG: zinc ribbon domain-containing protein [Euryarchaeota archaeon]|nr:zinc ribbon domain-containing protein [Euryarchaeota archaeon]
MKKECPNCKAEIRKDWKFCPYCGVMVNVCEEEVSVVNDLTTLNIMDSPKTGGISIHVNSHRSEKPRVSISAFGDFKKYEPELKRKMGALNNKKSRKVPAVIKEPDSILKKKKDKIIIKVKMSDVKEKDIKVNRYENSIEVKGYIPNKLYYTSFEVPNNSEIINKKLTEDIFTLVLKV